MTAPSGGSVRIEAEGQSDSNLRRIFTRYPLHRWGEALQKEFFQLHPGGRGSAMSFFPTPSTSPSPCSSNSGSRSPAT